MKNQESQPLENVIMSNNQMLLDIQDITHNLCLDYFEFFIYDTKFSFTFFKDIENLCRAELSNTNLSFNIQQFFNISSSYYSYLYKTQNICKLCIQHAKQIEPDIFRNHKVLVLFENRKTPSYLLTIQTLKQLRLIFKQNISNYKTVNLTELLKDLESIESELRSKQQCHEHLRIRQLEIFHEQQKNLEKIFDDVNLIMIAADLIFDQELHRMKKTFPISKLLENSIKTDAKQKN